jgi:ion channel-forming bestrophin family protein
MIVNRRVGLQLIERKSIPLLGALFAWDLLVVLVYYCAHRSWMDQPALPFSLTGSVLVLFQSLRNNAAYNRWWEARTLWGSVINSSRSFARQVISLLGGAPELTRTMIAYAYALREALRREAGHGEIERLLSPPMARTVEGYANRPNGILLEIARDARRIADECGVDPVTYAAIDRTLSDIANAQGGLERIRNTPLTIQFSILPRLLGNVFCAVLPFSMVQELGWLTPLGSTLVGFLLITLDEIGRDLELIFEDNPHALPMQVMSRTIEIDLLQSLGEAAPEPVLPVNGILH